MNAKTNAMVAGLLLAGGAISVTAQDAPVRDTRSQAPHFMRGPKGDGENVGKRSFGERPFERERQLLARFREENPEKYEELMRLREEDHDAFRREVGKLMSRRFRQGPEGVLPEEAKVHELAEKYHAAKSEEEKAAAKAELDESVGRVFDARVKEREMRLEKMEQQLQRLRALIEDRKEHRDDICRARVEELTADPNLRWNLKW